MTKGTVKRSIAGFAACCIAGFVLITIVAHGNGAPQQPRAFGAPAQTGSSQMSGGLG